MVIGFENWAQFLEVSLKRNSGASGKAQVLLPTPWPCVLNPCFPLLTYMEPTSRLFWSPIKRTLNKRTYCRIDVQVESAPWEYGLSRRRRSAPLTSSAWSWRTSASRARPLMAASCWSSRADAGQKQAGRVSAERLQGGCKELSWPWLNLGFGFGLRFGFGFGM